MEIAKEMTVAMTFTGANRIGAIDAGILVESGTT